MSMMTEAEYKEAVRALKRAVAEERWFEVLYLAATLDANDAERERKTRG